MFNFIVGNLVVIIILYLICLCIAYKYCYDGKADIWHNEMAEKIYYIIAPVTTILLFIEFILVIIWAVKFK